MVVGLFLFVVGCGGEVRGEGTAKDDPSAQRPPAAASKDGVPPPANDTRPNAPEPNTTPPPQKIGEPPAGAAGTPFHLVVTNRSKQAGAMKMDIEIDGTPVVTGTFAPDQTFTFDFAVEPGNHVVGARAEYVTLETRETFALSATGERWGVLDATTVRCDPCAPAILSWQVKTTPTP